MRSPCVLPDGALVLRHDPEALPFLDEALGGRILGHFEGDTPNGLLLLGARHPAALLPPAWSWLRDVSKAFVARVCAAPEAEAQRGSLRLALPEEEIAGLVDRVPAMHGAEYVGRATLEAWWALLHAAYAAALGTWEGTVEAWLQAQSPVWHRVGRVCFHLAERKGDAAAPFAFMATFTTGVSTAGRVQHAPLGRALQEASATRDHARLEALLEPVRRAMESSPVARRLVEAGEVFQAVSWGAPEAHAFLKDIPHFEAAGVSVRVPDWWSPKRPVRPQVQVTVGGPAGSYLGLDALLSFSVAVALDGVALTDEEVAMLQRAGSGLVQLRGRWVEVDAAKLDALLGQWRAAQRASRAGVSLHEALRMVAGAMATTGPALDDADDADGAWVRIEPGPALVETLRALRDPGSLGDLDVGDALRATLRPYQRVGLRWLWTLWNLGLGGCLADDMGLGKTLQVIALMVLERRHRKGPEAPHLLVVPASLMGNWRAELARFAPGLRVKVAHPSAGSEAPPGSVEAMRAWREDADVVISTYGVIAREAWARELDWSLAVLDEAQAIKNPDTQQARGVKTIQARGRFALTGTPVENRLGDLWSIFDYVQPGLLGRPMVFARYAKTLADGGSYAPLRRLVGPYILRRLKSDRSVAGDLPDKTEVTAWCRLTPVQARRYAEVVDDLKQRLASQDDGMARRGAVLGALTRLKQVCNHPSQAEGDGGYDPAASGKFERLGELAEEIAGRGEKALIFTQFQEMTEPLAGYLAGVFGAPGLVLHGGTPVRQRSKLVERFQTDPRVPFFVLSLKAGGTGLNLTAAQHVLHFDRWWNPAVENQATDRAYRIGQRRNVLVHRFVCKGTLEERIDAMLADKRALSEAILAPAAGAELRFTELPDAEILRVVSLDLARALDEV